MNRLEIQDNPRFKNRVLHQVPSKYPKARGDRVSNKNSTGEKVISHQMRSLNVPSVERVGELI